MKAHESDFVDAMKHAFDLMVATFMDNDAGVAGAEQRELRGAGRDSLGWKFESGVKERDGFFRNRAIRFDEVGLRDLRIRLHEPIRPAAVIRQDHQSRRAAIESPREVKGSFVRMIEKINDGGVLIVLRRAENAPRFVEHKIESLNGGLDRFVIKVDLIKSRYLGGMPRLGAAIDLRSPLYNPRPCAAFAHRLMFGNKAV